MTGQLIQPRRRRRLGLAVLALLIVGYVAANYAVTHSLLRGSVLFVPFFLAIVISNWLLMPPGPSLRLTPDALQVEGWGVLMRPTRIKWRDVDAFGIEPGNLCPRAGRSGIESSTTSMGTPRRSSMSSSGGGATH